MLQMGRFLEEAIIKVMTVYVFDTITDHYDFNQLANDTSIFFMPYEFYTQGQWARGYDQYYAYGGRHSKWIRDDNYLFNGSMCWIVYNGEWTGHEYEYSEGTGKTLDYYYQYDYMGGDGYSTALVYYQKGSQTWGTPVANSCNTLVGIGKETFINDMHIGVRPNPVESLAEITFHGLPKGEQFRIILSDCLGMKVRSEIYFSNPFVFNRSNLPSGMYFLTVLDKAGNFLGKTKILIR